MTRLAGFQSNLNPSYLELLSLDSELDIKESSSCAEDLILRRDFVSLPVELVVDRELKAPSDILR